MPLEPGRLRTLGRAAILVLAPTAMAALMLSPSLATGYIADDVISSLVPGMIRFTGSSVVGRTIEAMRSSIEGGRFYPLVWIEYHAAFCLVRDLNAYKGLILAGCLADLVLLMRLVRRAGGGRRLACLAAVATAMLFQFRAFFDPILSFHGLLQLIAALLIGSLLALQSYLDGRGRRWLVASVAMYLGCLLLYEVTYPLFLMHAAMIAAHRPSIRDRARLSLPFVLPAIACAGASVLVRRIFPGETYIHATNLDPAAVALALAKQTSAALPLSYFLADPAGLFADVRSPMAIGRWLARGDVLLVAALGAVAAVIGLLRDRGPSGPESPASNRGRGTLAVLGLLLAVLPGGMIAISSRYQSEIGFGKGYLPVYLQCLGVGLLLATAMVAALDRLHRSRPAAVIALAAAIGSTAGLTYRANSDVAIRLISPPGTRHFHPAAAGMGGASHAQRRNIEAALRSGLLDDLPDGATLLLANAYPGWHEPPFSTFFYLMHADGPLATASRTDTAVPADGNAFVLRDVCLDLRAGYVLLWPQGRGPDRPGPIRLFVRHPGIDPTRHGPAFAVVADATDRPGATTLLPGDEVPVVRSGDGWALLELRGDGTPIDPDSIRLAFDRPTILASLEVQASADTPGGRRSR